MNTGTVTVWVPHCFISKQWSLILLLTQEQATPAHYSCSCIFIYMATAPFDDLNLIFYFYEITKSFWRLDIPFWPVYFYLLVHHWWFGFIIFHTDFKWVSVHQLVHPTCINAISWMIWLQPVVVDNFGFWTRLFWILNTSVITFVITNGPCQGHCNLGVLPCNFLGLWSQTKSCFYMTFVQPTYHIAAFDDEKPA